MNWRFPLYARFLIWFGLNLLLLAAVLVALVRTEFRIESLLSTLAADRVQPVADVIVSELRSRPQEQWSGILKRFEEAYGARFSLLDDRNDLLAGAPVTLPEVVRNRLPGMPSRGGMEFNPGPPPNPGDPPDGPGPERRGGLRRPGGGQRPGAAPLFFRTREPAGYWAVIRAPITPPESGRPSMGRLVVFSQSLSAGGLFLDPTPWLWAAGLVLTLSALWWIPFVSSITRSIRQMTAATERIAEGRFDIQVNERRRDELGRLGGAINRMSVRLSSFVTGQKRFLGDAAHELCSPLARMEMALGILESRVDASDRDYVGDVRDEARHMSRLVDELLQFSKAGLRPKESVLQTVDLRPLIDRILDREGPAPEGITVAPFPPLAVRAQPELLERALGNLVRNAIRYAGKHGQITLSAAVVGSHVHLCVADMGPGVPGTDLARLGEPFFRPDTARTQETGGTGLGLAIVRTCMEACGGRVSFENRSPQGFLATLTLDQARP
ncbi:MAG: sensor histidine kinase [Limisphaerales bacterium]